MHIRDQSCQRHGDRLNLVFVSLRSHRLRHLKGMCQPRKMGTVGAEPFSAKLRYTGADDPQHPNLIKVAVTMPHIDGTWELRAGLVPQMKCNATCVIFTSGAPLQPECRSCQVASNLRAEPRSTPAT